MDREELVMAERESPAQRSRRQTAKSIEAGKKNLAKGVAENKKRREEGRAQPDSEPASERWAKLLDGRLTVADLSDDEISHMRVRNVDGTFTGRSRKLPSHIAQQFHQEAIKRANAQFRKALSSAVRTLAEIAADPDVKESDRIKAANIIVDRVLGKSVETVRIEDNRFDTLLSQAVGLERDLDDDAPAKG